MTEALEKVDPVISENRPVTIVDQNGSWYLVDGDGQPLPGAEEPHESREEAQAHLDSLIQGDKPLQTEPTPYTDGPEEMEKIDQAEGLPKNVFIPLTKIDEQRQEVWGYAALEEPDQADEVMDYESSKPFWQRWSESAQKRSGGRSFGNLRSMHKAVAAGKLIAFTPDDEHKGFFIGGHVVDPDEWRKVQTGVYTGFSVGGNYVRKWVDARMGKMRYTANPVEVSLVDSPCMPSAYFQVIKANGLTEDRPFQPGSGDNVLQVVPEELEKVDLPTAPAAAGSIPAESENVARIPDPDLPMQINPENPPSGEDLAARHTGVEELPAQDTSGADETDAEVKKFIKVKPRRLIKVRRPRLIKVVRS